MYTHIYTYIKPQIVHVKGRTEDRKDEMGMSRTEEAKIYVSSL